MAKIGLGPGQVRRSWNSRVHLRRGRRVLRGSARGDAGVVALFGGWSRSPSPGRARIASAPGQARRSRPQVARPPQGGRGLRANKGEGAKGGDRSLALPRAGADCEPTTPRGAARSRWSLALPRAGADCELTIPHRGRPLGGRSPSPGRARIARREPPAADVVIWSRSPYQGIPNQLAKVKRHQLQEACSPRPTRRSLQPPEGVREQ
jgi:hypothetical protein